MIDSFCFLFSPRFSLRIGFVSRASFRPLRSRGRDVENTVRLSDQRQRPFSGRHASSTTESL